MNKQQLAWIVALAVLTLLVAATAPAFSMVQDPAAAGQQTPGGEIKPGAGGAGSPDATVEQILKQQEEMLSGRRFSYEPDNRRDPFQSLYEGTKHKEGPRPPGIEGMSVDEIDLTGIVQDANGGNVAYFTGSDNKGYFLRVGQRIFDSTMIAIDPVKGAVTFRQQIDDPRQIKPYRDVVRQLVPVDEESAHE